MGIYRTPRRRTLEHVIVGLSAALALTLVLLASAVWSCTR